MKTYRNTGAYGALIDEYERAVNELANLVAPLSQNQLISIVDAETKDDDCRSIQTILTHVVHSGYAYAVIIRNHQGESLNFFNKVILPSASDYVKAIKDMMSYSIKMMEDYPAMVLEESDNSKKFVTGWGQMYDVEQLLEHAIVHILRHRRQIERFLLKLK